MFDEVICSRVRAVERAVVELCALCRLSALLEDTRAGKIEGHEPSFVQENDPPVAGSTNRSTSGGGIATAATTKKEPSGVFPSACRNDAAGGAQGKPRTGRKS
jgi:hypothetical protein